MHLWLVCLFFLSTCTSAQVCQAKQCYIGGTVQERNLCDRETQECPMCLVGTEAEAGCFNKAQGWCNVGTDCTGVEIINQSGGESDETSSTGLIVGIVIAIIGLICIGAYFVVRSKHRKQQQQQQHASTQRPTAPTAPYQQVVTGKAIPMAQPVWQSQV